MAEKAGLRMTRGEVAKQIQSKLRCSSESGCATI